MQFKHLNDVNQSYIVHALNAGKFGCFLMYFSIRTFIHALYPDVFTDTTKVVRNFILEIK